MTENPQNGPIQSDGFPDAGRIVDAFGGVRPMAARLGIAATTIQGWKSRGNIPAARRPEVRDAAQAAGIDLSDLAMPDAATTATPAGDDAGSSATAAATTTVPAPQSARNIAWLALAVAAMAGIAVATQPLWAPRQSDAPSVGPAIDRLAARIAVLEAVPAPNLGPLAARIDALEAVPAPNLGPLAARIDALEAASRSLLDAAARQEPAPPDLTPRLNTVMERLEALSTAMQMADRSESTVRAAEVGAIRTELAALATRLDDAVVRDAPVGAAAASLVLAIATLEDAVLSGAPFKMPLSVIERFAQGDAALAGFIALLSPHAGTGVPTHAQLVRDFQAIATQLSAPLWPESGVSWIDGVLEKIDSLVTIRRLEDGGGRASPVVQVERALADNDLARAVAALAATDGPGAAWASRANSRIAANRAIAGLRLLALESLGPPAENSR